MTKKTMTKIKTSRDGDNAYGHEPRDCFILSFLIVVLSDCHVMFAERLQMYFLFYNAIINVALDRLQLISVTLFFLFEY